MIVDTKVRKCDSLVSTVYFEIACKDAKYYGMDTGGKTIDLCPECFKIYCLMLALRSIAPPFIVCEFCGRVEQVNPRQYNGLYEAMDDRYGSTPRTAKLACTDCYDIYLKTGPGTHFGPGLVPEFHIEMLKKKVIWVGSKV